MGVPEDALAFYRRGDGDKGMLMAIRFARHDVGWMLNVMYVPDITGPGSDRPPTYPELLLAKLDLLPPDCTMALVFPPADHAEGRIADRANLVLWEIGAGAGGLILLPPGSH